MGMFGLSYFGATWCVSVDRRDDAGYAGCSTPSNVISVLPVLFDR